MLIGYVSDERYVALFGVQLEFESDAVSLAARSRASGAVHADLPAGRYRVTLAKSGYGSKRVEMTVDPGRPYHFRLLKDGLLAYAWPKWVQSGRQAEFRVHSSEAYKLSLWRYGWQKELVRKIGWFDEHGPRATVQITPDGDYTQTGAQWNKHGYTSPHHKQFVTAPGRSGLYYFHAKTESGAFFSFPWIVAPAKPRAPIAVLASNVTWNAYNSFGGRSNYIHPDRLPPTPTVNARLELKRYTDPGHVNYDTDDYAPLSFDRPEPINHIPEHVDVTDPIEGRAACHVAPAEWRLFGWLEREGFEYDLYAETQLHFGALRLDDYRVRVIS
ncbi:MAG TPA: N,N-dimethylformamidase beta subunit family domain-containing protein, partial [Planctomycetaceae bacterium]|nr:N,N-dimethylformamidase beta subunit family domain-containing protein [Planctomycetaceae bacterium]